VRALAASFLAIGLFAASGCGSGSSPNLLVIVVDTLRADHLGAYGYPRSTSPAIDSLASQGVLFRRAYATAPWTQPSVASLITGLHPASHQVDRLMRVLPASADTLAEVLSREGYATAAVVSHWLIGARFQFDQGYGTFRETQGGAETLSTPSVTAEAIQMLVRLAGNERPFYLFVHYFDPHYSYRHHPEFGLAAPSEGRLDGSEEIWDLRSLDPPPDESERSFIRDLYDGEIRFTDDGIARLLGELERLGVSDDTWVVFVADHGEEFFERGWLGHTRTLYEELIRVPLVIRPPGGTTPRVVQEPLSLVSLMPTLLDLLGLDAEDPSLAGASFAPLISGSGSWRPAAITSEVDRYDERAGQRAQAAAEDSKFPTRTMVRKQAVLEGRWKLVVDRLSGSRELYDLDADPAERNDLASREPQVVARMMRQLETAIADARERRLPRVGAERIQTESELQRLIDLGYVTP